MASFRLTREAIDDVDAIWLRIYEDNPNAADAVEEEIRSTCALLAENPLQGHLRRDLTKRPLRFWTLPKYPNYMIVYDPHARPVAILRVLHGMRDLKRLLKITRDPSLPE
jgi:plasmid stabilization system protein ParE